MTRHVKTVHEKTEIYICTQCGFKSHHATSLTAHIKNVHDKIKNYKCNFCQESFLYKKALDKHLLNKHQSETTITYTIIE